MPTPADLPASVQKRILAMDTDVVRGVVYLVAEHLAPGKVYETLILTNSVTI